MIGSRYIMYHPLSSNGGSGSTSTDLKSNGNSGSSGTSGSSSGSTQANDAVTRLSVDLTTLSGWSEWYKTAAVGAHDLTVKAKADNWQTSDASAAVKLYIDSVTIDGANLAEYEGVVKILRGTAYSYTFATISSNYTFDGVTPTVKIGGTDYTGFVWSSTTGKLDIPANGVTGNIAITLKAVGKSFAVTNDLTNCTSNGAATAQYGTDYVATLTADSGFNLSAEGATAPTVTIGGKSYTGFQWLPGGTGNSGSLTIPGTAITGAVAISCKAGAKSYSTVFNLTGCTTSSPDTHTAESDLSLVFLRSTGYEFSKTGKPTVTFTSDGSTDAVNVSDLCTWTLPQAGFDTATLVVPKAYTVGTVTVTLAAVKQTFTVTTNITNCTMTGIPSTVEYGARLSGMVTPASGFTLKGTTPVVTIGGGGYTGFTYAAGAPSATGTTYNFAIPAGAIIGDVVITIDAIGQKLAAPQNVAIDGTVVSWDEVENATSYDILADGTSIGEYVVPTGYKVTLTSWDEEVGGAASVAVKFNTPPTSSNDYDYRTGIEYDDTGLYNASGVKVTQPVTVNEVSKAYVFVHDGALLGQYKLNGVTGSDVGNWTEPAVISLTQDSTLSLLHAQD